MNRTTFSFGLILISTLSFANVNGNKSEVFGTQWKQRSYEHWIMDPDAVITPEFSNLATQSCLRQSQEQLDFLAYKKTHELVQEMRKSFTRDSAVGITKPYDTGLSALTDILASIDKINAENAGEYRQKCESTVTKVLSKPQVQSELTPLYYGRFNPEISKNLPPEIKAKLEKMSEKGLQLAPLTWQTLIQQVCTLEGYYSTTTRPELWKFFSITRALGNILPAEKDDHLFIQSVSRSNKIVELITSLNHYSAVAGKMNGPTIGMSLEEKKAAGVRLTGAALGSKATSIMAFFTTGWREEIQRFVIEQDYPEKPFMLTQANTILSSMKNAAEEVKGKTTPSQTELGMSLLWDSFLAPAVTYEREEYGRETQNIKATFSMAWLALNAETNIRQNEKITGYGKTSVETGGDVTAPIYGTRTQYLKIVSEISAAKAAYRAIALGDESLPYCVNALLEMNQKGVDNLGEIPTFARFSAESLNFLREMEFKPVIADIGMEINDERGDRPEGIFRLHLATGFGHAVEANIQGRVSVLWIPSSMVLHLPSIETTDSWRNASVTKYDPFPVRTYEVLK